MVRPTRTASETVVAASERAVSTPISASLRTKRSRSSVASIVSGGVPSTRTP